MRFPALVASAVLAFGFAESVSAYQFYVKVENRDDIQAAVIHVQNPDKYPRVEAKGWKKQPRGQAVKFGYGKMETNETFWVIFRKNDGSLVKLKRLDASIPNDRERIRHEVLKARFPSTWDDVHYNAPNARELKKRLLDGDVSGFGPNEAEYWCIRFTPTYVQNNKNGEVKWSQNTIRYKSPGAQGADVWIELAEVQ